MMIYLYRKKSPLVPHKGDWHYIRFDPVILKALVTRGLPMGAQMIVVSCSAIAMMSLVNQFGVQTPPLTARRASCGLTCKCRRDGGRRVYFRDGRAECRREEMGRVHRVAMEGVKLSVIATATPVILILLLHRPILSLFLPVGSEAIHIAERIDSIVLWNFVLISGSFALTGVVRATGAVLIPC